MQITTYNSAKAWPEKKWLASLDITGDGSLLMSFFGKTEDEALAKANSWWTNEVARQKRLETPDEASATDDYQTSKGRGAHLVGVVWMIHSHSREKIRVQQNEVALYEGRGYVRGGPRSK